MQLVSGPRRVATGVGVSLLVLTVVGCADDEPDTDEYGWVEESFEDLVDREMEIRETADWYAAPLEIEPERFIASGESEQVHGSCMDDAGWQGVAQHVDILELPAEQRDAAEDAYWECVARFPADPRTIGNFGSNDVPEQFFRALYEDEQRLRECLEGEGFNISEGPSFEIYQDVQRSGDPARTAEAQHPYIEIQLAYGIDALDDAEAACSAGDRSDYLPDIPDAE